jgi:NAD(P)-dependent dehydrogenase (short-subunit alcohol dehydrogenase family)
MSLSNHIQTQINSEMKNKICLVTGATAGIGLVTARELARMGAEVILVGRDSARCHSAVATIVRDSGNANVSCLVADLSSQAGVRRLAAEFLATHNRLDVLVNNAGALFAVRRESVDGIEMTMALNHLGPFLLTTLLLDALKAAAPARIVNVASEAHEDVTGFDFDDPQATRGYPRSEWGSAFYSLAMPWAHPAFRHYARSKLANIFFTTELARRLDGSGVTVNALHPGIVASNFSADNGVYGWFMARFFSFRGISVDEGAKTSLYLASSPEVDGVTGRYFVQCKPQEPSAAARDAGMAARLWQWSEAMTAPSHLRHSVM